MTAQGAFKITEEFERLLCEYTGAPHAVAVDNCSNALFLALVRADVRGRDVLLPRYTYPSVPCEVIHAGGRVRWAGPGAFHGERAGYLTGPYMLGATRVVDSALRFTAGMYDAARGNTICLSFTGPYKHLKLGKGGAILTDSAEDAAWYKRARFSGRRECSYHDDTFDMLGWNFYMLPEIAARGVALMAGFWRNGVPVSNPDLCLPFPDLSRFPIYQQGSAKSGFVSVAEAGQALDRVGRLLADFKRRSSREHVGAQSGTVTREEVPPIRCELPPPAEPWPDYDSYRGNQ